MTEALVTACTVSLYGMTKAWSGLWHVEVRGRRFERARDVQCAWFDAIAAVPTPYFFFIDDDDDLPADYLQVIDRCMKADAAIAYTDEMVDGQRRHRADYSQAAHLANPQLVHHLVLCRTADARAALEAVPRGDFWPEMLLYWQMAKIGCAKHVPEVGYHWQRRPDGLHRWHWTVRGIHNSLMWCKSNA